MEAVEIKAWCQRHHLEPSHALVLSGVCDVSDDVLQEVLSSVKILGKTKIVDRRDLRD